MLLPACSKDKPEDIGYPPVEPVSDKQAAANLTKPKPDVLKQLVNTVLKNPFIWGMALTYFFIYVVRQVRIERMILAYLVSWHLTAWCARSIVSACTRSVLRAMTLLWRSIQRLQAGWSPSAGSGGKWVFNACGRECISKRSCRS